MFTFSGKTYTKFDADEFLSPDICFAPVYSWSWNAPVSKEETDRQLDEFVRLGIKAFYILPMPKDFRPTRIPTLMKPDYLTEEFFSAVEYALGKAFSLGMTAWIYDEGGFPSGGACGKVLKIHPEYARQGLDKRDRYFQKGDVYHIAADSACFFTDGVMIPDGYVFDRDMTTEEYYARTFLFDDKPNADLPDLTDRRATDVFIKLTHENYKKHLNDCFGKNIFAVFSDESEAPRPIPFSPRLSEEFEKVYGYSILPFLNIIWRRVVRIWSPDDQKPYLPDDKQTRAIIDWFDFCATEFCKNYLEVEKKWCNDNGLLFTGHLNGDDLPMGSIRSASYHLFRALRCFDVPGIDVIWRQIYPGKKRNVFGEDICENKFFPRYASSCAAQTGGKRAMSESFAVYGNGLTYDTMRYVCGFQAIRGINVFNPMNVSYGKKGFLLAGIAPQFDEKFACYKDLKVFNEYLERLSYICSVGTRKVSCALYFPMNDIYAGLNDKEVCTAFEKAGEDLENSSVCFDVFDDDVIIACDDDLLKEGVIVMGYTRYTELVVPACDYMPDGVIRRLEEFIRGGGKVYTLIGAAEINGAERINTLNGLFESTVKFTGDSSDIIIHERILENGKLVVLFNQSFVEKKILIEVGKEKVFVVDISCGRTFYPQKNDGIIEITLRSGETAALVFSEEKLSDVDLFFKNSFELRNEWLLKKETRFTLNQDGFDLINEEGSFIPATLGNWRKTLGDDYSGSCVYKTEFDRPVGVKDNIVIDFGKVNYSCEVFLNGISLGVRIFAPYRFEVPTKLLQDDNLLEIRVSNTVANEFYYTKFFNKYEKWQLTGYYDRQKEFAKDSLDSGLFGPVIVKY